MQIKRQIYNDQQCVALFIKDESKAFMSNLVVAKQKKELGLYAQSETYMVELSTEMLELVLFLVYFIRQVIDVLN